MNCFRCIQMASHDDNGIIGAPMPWNTQTKGLSVIITDHHEPHPDGLLPNLRKVDPSDDSYPFKALGRACS